MAGPSLRTDHAGHPDTILDHQHEAIDGEGADESEDDSEMVITGEHSDAVAAVMAGTSKKQPAPSSKKEYVAQYQASITKAIRDLKVSAGSFLIPEELATYSPKFLHLLQMFIRWHL
jgi:hypothetical protein